MPSKNKNKSPNPNDKPAVLPQDDPAKKIPKVSRAESPANSRSCNPRKLSKLLSALSYFVLVSGAAFASFYLQRVLNEVNQIRAESEEALQKNSEMLQKVQHALQQVNSMKVSLDDLETAVGRTQGELESTNRAIIKGETETRRVEEVLQKLQNEILQDLSEGIREVKQAREHDFSSLEKTLEVRLAELSRSIADSVAEFTGAQEEAQAQLSKLKIRLEEHSEPGNLKDELLSITTSVTNLHTANEVAEGNMGVLREQIVSVRSELQTRNKEVASLSEEIEAIRSLIRTTADLLRQEVSASQATVQGMSHQMQRVQDEQFHTSQALQNLQTDLTEERSRREIRGDDLEARLKIIEEKVEALENSAEEQTNRVEAFLSKYDAHESLLATQSQASEKARQAFKEELGELKFSLGELHASFEALAESDTSSDEMDRVLLALQTELEDAGEKAAGKATKAPAEEEIVAVEATEEEAVGEEISEEEGAAEVIEDKTAVEEVAEEDFVIEDAVEDDSVVDEEVLP